MTLLPNNNCYVFACGMERSGSSVYMRMITMLIQAANLGRKVGDARLGPFAEVAPAIMQQAQGVPGLKLIRTHDYHPLFEAEFQRDNAIGLYVWRDIRDVMVSYTLRASTEWTLDDADWVISNVKRIAANRAKWLQWAPGLLLVNTYQDVIHDKPGLLLRTGRALGIRINAQQATAASRMYEIDRMKETLPPDHINDGRAGMWRDHITDQQANRLQEIVDEYAPQLQMETGQESARSLGRCAVRDGAGPAH
jgi:hypothetical protein